LSGKKSNVKQGMTVKTKIFIVLSWFLFPYPILCASETKESEVKAAKITIAKPFEKMLRTNPFKSPFYQIRWLASRQKSALIDQLKKLPAGFDHLRKELAGKNYERPELQTRFVFRIIIPGTECSLCKQAQSLYWALKSKGYTVDVVTTSAKLSKPFALDQTPNAIPKTDREAYKWNSLPSLLIGERPLKGESSNKKNRKRMKAVKVKPLPIEIAQLENLLGSW